MFVKRIYRTKYVNLSVEYVHRSEDDARAPEEPLLPPPSLVRGRHAANLHELSRLQRGRHRILQMCQLAGEVLQAEDARRQAHRLSGVVC